VAYALTRPSQVGIPDVIGQEVGAATQILQTKGFNVTIKPVPSGVPRDQVVEQDPIPTDRGGGKADEGSTVTLSVSSGPAVVSVPEVANLSEPDATKRLEGAGFKVSPSFRFSDSVPRGRAVGTEPAAGTQLSTQQPVILLISKGSNTVAVPNVVGLDDQSALTTLQNAGLAGVEVQRDSSEPAGKVIAQSPGPSKRVNRGSQVTIFASTGAVSVPNVVGQSQQSAVTAIKRAGFVAAVTQQQTSDPAQVGRVISEFPPGGSRGQRGDTVTIAVGTSSTTTP
jgi:beta-lactam-binding protein with PASTA domain